MIRENSTSQQSLSGFEWPFQNELDPRNRWVVLAQSIPWDALSQSYLKAMDDRKGRPALRARVVIGALIIKHKLVLSDRETISLIQENPYLQYFLGQESYSSEKVFDPSLFVTIRRRMGAQMFEEFTQSITDALKPGKSKPRGAANKQRDKDNDDNDEPPASQDSKVEESSQKAGSPEQQPHQGKLIVDATVADQAIRYPTDVSLLNEAREFSEKIIDCLHGSLTDKRKKPRTYRRKARGDYLSFAKRRSPSKKIIRKAIRKQLQYLRRNLGHIEELLEQSPQGQRLALPNWLLRRYWVLPHLYGQQKQMFDDRVNRCDDRIVSIHQPWVRPIVRGKQHKPTEFGAKINVSMDAEGIARVDHHGWDAYNEGQDLEEQVERYKDRHGYYPEVVLADPIYGTRSNRAYLKSKGIRYGGKPLGRPRKKTQDNAEELQAEKKQRQEDYRQRIPIEGKFGQGKGGYRLNYVRARRADTSQAWVNAIFLVMNLLVLYELFFWLFNRPLQWLKGAISNICDAVFRGIGKSDLQDPNFHRKHQRLSLA